MWTFTDRGFYSVVEDKADRSRFVVRSRARGDLENLRTLIPGLKIVVLKNRDYEFRAYVERGAWIAALAEMTGEIDYTNFKDAVTARQGQARHDIYMRIWSAALAIARTRPKASAPAESRLFSDVRDMPWDDSPLAKGSMLCPHGKPMLAAWERVVNRSAECAECSTAEEDFPARRTQRNRRRRKGAQK